MLWADAHIVHVAAMTTRCAHVKKLARSAVVCLFLLIQAAFAGRPRAGLKPLGILFCVGHVHR